MKKALKHVFCEQCDKMVDVESSYAVFDNSDYHIGACLYDAIEKRVINDTDIMCVRFANPYKNILCKIPDTDVKLLTELRRIYKKDAELNENEFQSKYDVAYKIYKALNLKDVDYDADHLGELISDSFESGLVALEFTGAIALTPDSTREMVSIYATIGKMVIDDADSFVVAFYGSDNTQFASPVINRTDCSNYLQAIQYVIGLFSETLISAAVVTKTFTLNEEEETPPVRRHPLANKTNVSRIDVPGNVSAPLIVDPRNAIIEDRSKQMFVSNEEGF